VSEKIQSQSQQKFIHKLIFFAAIATPIMTLPQVYQIWVLHQKGASAITWASYVFIACIWLYYGIENKDKPIVIMQSLCIVVYGAIVVGLLIK
jgi:MtN3 and saliva related transmembrane protein